MVRFSRRAAPGSTRILEPLTKANDGGADLGTKMYSHPGNPTVDATFAGAERVCFAICIDISAARNTGCVSKDCHGGIFE